MKAKVANFNQGLTESRTDFFQCAAILYECLTLSDCMIVPFQCKLKNMMEMHKVVIASTKDGRIFFDAIMNPPEPSKNLRATVKKYNKQGKGK